MNATELAEKWLAQAPATERAARLYVQMLRRAAFEALIRLEGTKPLNDDDRVVRAALSILAKEALK